MNRTKCNRYRMKNICAMLMIVVLVMTGMSGCKLATEDGSVGAGGLGDKLIGVMVTKAPIEGQKVYGEQYEEDGGIKVRFDIDGAMTVYEVQGNDVLELVYDEYYNYEKVEILSNETDDALVQTEKHNLELYYDEELEGEIVYFNGIYVDGDNKIYVAGGEMGNMISSYSSNLNITMKSKMTEESDGQTVQKESVFSIDLIKKYICDSVNIIYMADDSKEISRKTYVKGEYPDSITIPSGVSYIVIENIEGNEIRERELINIVDYDAYITFAVYVKGEGGFVIPHVVEVK